MDTIVWVKPEVYLEVLRKLLLYQKELEVIKSSNIIKEIEPLMGELKFRRRGEIIEIVYNGEVVAYLK